MKKKSLNPFDYIKPILKSQTLINQAMSKIKNQDPKSKIIVLKNFYVKQLEIDFPDLNEINDFYKDLALLIVNKDELLKNLYKINKSIGIIEKLSKDFYANKKNIMKLSHYIGRINSVIKRLNKTLNFLEDTRRKLKRLPSIDLNKKSLIIIGNSNVGKTSIFKELTKTNPDIANYAFTTKFLNTYQSTIQFIDTPGLTERLFKQEKLNNIELITLKTLEYLNNKKNKYLFVVDIAEASYSLDYQIKTLIALNNLNINNIYIFLNKQEFLNTDELKAKLNLVKSKIKSNSIKTKKIIKTIKELKKCVGLQQELT